MKTIWKGLIMALVGFIATTIADIETFNLAYVGISTLAFTLLYLGKNWAWPSTSPSGQINWGDILSGLLIAVSMGISSFAGSILTTGAVDLHALWVAVIGAIIGYFIKTTPSPAIAKK